MRILTQDIRIRRILFVKDIATMSRSSRPLCILYAFYVSYRHGSYTHHLKRRHSATVIMPTITSNAIPSTSRISPASYGSLFPDTTISPRPSPPVSQDALSPTSGILSLKYFSRSSISSGAALCTSPRYVRKSTFQPHSFSFDAVSCPHSYLTMGSLSP